MRVNNIPQTVAAAIDLLRETVDDHEGLSRRVRLRIAAAVRRAIVPKVKSGRPKGRPKDRRFDMAYTDYEAGVPRLELFRRYIPTHDSLSEWRRAYEQKRLLQTLRKRREREKKRQQCGVTKSVVGCGLSR